MIAHYPYNVYYFINWRKECFYLTNLTVLPLLAFRFQWSLSHVKSRLSLLLEWVKLIQMNIISTTVGNNPLLEMSSPHSQQKSPKCSTWLWSQKWQNELCFQCKVFSITVIQVCAPNTNAEEVEVEQSMKTNKTF